MQLNPSEISELIKSKIENLASASEARTQGTVVSVTDGICRVHGLSDAMQGEMLEFPNNTFGLALNLERDSVGSVILGDYTHITEGDIVTATQVDKVVTGFTMDFVVTTDVYQGTGLFFGERDPESAAREALQILSESRECP